jgi:hypothetical protein
VTRNKILRAGMMAHVVFNKSGNFGVLQMTIPQSLVEIRLKFRSPLVLIFDSPKMLPFSAQGGRETVGKMKSHELR